MPRREVRLSRQRSTFLVKGTPIISVMLGSMITTALPIVAQWPMMPPLGLMLFLAWRLLRPELWPVWMGFPLGLFDDLMTGQPLGSSAFLWTMVMFAMEAVSHRMVWRDYWQDWFLATLSIIACVLAGWGFARLLGSGGHMMLVLPQIMWSVLFFPFLARICAMLDRWRLPT